MISAGGTQEVNHVLSSVGDKLFHYFFTNLYRPDISKKMKHNQALVCSLTATDHCVICCSISKRPM